MRAMRLAEVARAVDGRLVDDPGDLVVTGAAADSRAATTGDLFVAIAGERVDGHDFVDAAIANGAVATLATRPVGSPAVVVADPVAALGRLAHYLITLLPELDVVALTGSSGKTTTKDVLGAILARRGPVVAPLGSFNTEVGLPLTVLRCDDDTRTLVLEMGARGRGHIAYLCGIAQPRIGVVLNVGSAHVGEFGSRQAIAEAKAELPGSLPPDGVAILNSDDPLVSAMASPAGVLTFGLGPRADVRIENLQLDAAIRPQFDLLYRGERCRVQLRIAGEHNAANAAAAGAAGLALGMELAEVAAALGEAEVVSRWRMEVGDTPGGATVINDAYNANPESVAAALKALAEFGRRRPGSTTWAVLGEMRELGADSAQEHDAIGRLAVRLHIHRLIAVGEGARAIHLGAAHEGSWAGESAWVPDAGAAAAVLREQVQPGDVVLVKASRAVGLEQVAAQLLADGGER